MSEIYFDNASTTRVDDSVIAQMADVMKNEYGNPSSLHSRGVAAERRVAAAAEQVLSALGAKTGQLVFTSGGTEANNLAVFGSVEVKKRRGRRIVTTAIEHSSVLECVRELARRGFDVVEVPCEADGRMDAQRMLAACNADTILVSMMLVNNEVGCIQPLGEVVQGVRAGCPHAVIHTDAVQALGKIPFSASALGVDLLTISGHKIHAPKGCGALYLAQGVRVSPLLYGGDQQRGLHRERPDVRGAGGGGPQRLDRAFGQPRAGGRGARAAGFAA
jgi:cysteine desulfurase